MRETQTSGRHWMPLDIHSGVRGGSLCRLSGGDDDALGWL